MEQKTYITKQKIQIIELLKNNKNKHMTADDMLFLLTAQKINVSRATLYRYLDVLVSTGEVRKIFISEGSKACYQYIDNTTKCKEHFHLVCTECGKLQHMECSHVEDIIKHVEKEHHFLVDPGRVVFYGICSECAKKEEKEV